MVPLLLIIFAVTCVILVESSTVHHDRDVVSRIPREIKESIDEVVKQRFQRAISSNFEVSGSPRLFRSGIIVSPMIENKYRRMRRDVTNSTVNSTIIKFSEWSGWSECDAKCDGGQQIRFRTCLTGDCNLLGGRFTNSRECGMFPCVAGSYALDSITAIGQISITGAKHVKFFSIGGMRYFGFVTDTEMKILKFSYSLNEFVDHQTIPVTSGIAFDILNTYPRTYIVVIQKALSKFPGRFSKMYYYDAWEMKFKTETAITIDVWEPSAVKTFDVFGAAFLGVVNYQTKLSNYGFTQQLLVCKGQTRTASCPGESIISVVNAIYGRATNYECASGVDIYMSWFQYFATCVVPGAKEKVAALCAGKTSCELTASAVNFISIGGISCPQTNNYLRVTYTCSSISYMGMPIFYKWDGVGLSLVSSARLITYGATDIEAFSIHQQQYIAVANYINDQKVHHLDSEIYLYNLESERFQSLQRLRTDGAVDWEFFSIGEGLAREYFIAVANHMKILPNGVKTYEVNSVIYKWNWNLFVPFQCIKTYGATKWTGLAGDDGRFTLAVTNLYGNTTFYDYDGWRFNEAEVQPEDEIFENAKALYVHRLTGEPMFIVQNTNLEFNSTRNHYKTNFMKTFPKYELLESTLRAVQKLNRTVYEDLFPEAEAFNKSYNAVKDDIVFTDNVNITVHKTFKDINVKRTTTVQSANITTVNLSPADHDRQDKIKGLNQTLSFIGAYLREANATLDNVVTKSTEQVISSSKIFNNASFSRLIVNNDMHVGGNVNGIRISHVRKNALYLNTNAVISGKYSFSNVSIEGNVTVTGTFGNIQPKNLVTVDKSDIISGSKTFANVRFEGTQLENIEVGGLVNGVNTSELLTVSGDQYIEEDYVFNNTAIIIGDLDVTATVNNIVLSEIVADTVMTNDRNITIHASKIFDTVNILQDLQIKDNATINGVDVSELSKIGFKLSPDSLNSSLTFTSNVTFLSKITVLGEVNGINLSNVVYGNVDAVLVGPKTITGNVNSTANINITGNINGVNLSNVLDTVNIQTISGKKNFSSDLTVQNDVTTAGLVDGVNVSHVYSQSLLMNSTQVITGYKIFKKLTVNHLELKECEHDCKLLQILKNIKYQCAKRSNPILNITGEKRINDITILGNAEVSGFVNGVKLPGDLLVQGASQTINGSNTFSKNVAMLGNVNATSINGVDIDTMYKKALSKSNLTLSGKVILKDDIIVEGNLNVTGHINNVDFKDVVLTKGKQTITGNKTFTKHVYIKELRTKTMVTTGYIDGVNLTSLESELRSFAKSRIVKGTKIFRTNVTYDGHLEVSELIDGVNITELYNNAMRLDGDQVVTGKKVFDKQVTVTKNLSVKGLVDGVNLTEMAAYAILTSGSKQNQTIDGNVTFANITLKNNLHLTGSLNGNNFNEIVDNTLMKSGEQIVTGNHSVGNLVVSGVVDVRRTVNGLNFSEEVVPLQNPGKITGRKTFENVTTMENVNITNEINGFNLSQFAKRVAYINEDTVLSGFITLENDLVVQNNLTVIGFINDQNITNIVKTTILKAGNQTILKPIHFREVIFTEDVTTKYFNSINLTSFSNDVIYKCIGRNRNITGRLSFNNLTVAGLTEVVNFVANGDINKINIQLLDKQAVKVYGNNTIDGLKRVNGVLTVQNMTTGRINNFKFPSDFVTVSGDDEISARKLFTNDVTVNGNITVAGKITVNDVDLSEIDINMVKLSANETISSPVVFHSNVTVLTNLDVQLVNGLNIAADELLLKHRNQTITAKKIFTDVYTNGDVVSSNNINGIDLKAVRDESVMTGRINVLTGITTVVGNVTVKSNLHTNLVDGVNVTTLFSGFNKISNLLDTRIQQLNKSIDIHRKVISQLSGSIGNVHQSLDYFIEDQDIMLPYVSMSIDVHKERDEVWLAAGSLSNVYGQPCTNTSVFVRSYRNKTESTPFTPRYSVLTNAISGIKFFNTANDIYLASSSNRRNDGCFPNLPSSEHHSTTYRYNEGNDIFQKYASVRTNRAVGLDVHVSGDNVTTLFTNTFLIATNCVQQSLHSLTNPSYALIGSFRSCNAIKSVILMQDDDKTTVALLGSNYVDYRNLEIVDIYKNGSTSIKQVIATHYASDIIEISSAGGSFIVIANTYDSSEEALAISYTVPVSVYRLETTGLYEPYQNIDVKAAMKMQPFKIGIYDYIAIATYEQEIVILKHKGASKWNIELKVPIQGYGSIKDLETWTFDDEVFMAVLMSNTWNSKHPSKIRVMKAYLTSTVEGTDIIENIDI